MVTEKAGKGKFLDNLAHVFLPKSERWLAAIKRRTEWYWGYFDTNESRVLGCNQLIIIWRMRENFRILLWGRFRKRAWLLPKGTEVRSQI